MKMRDKKMLPQSHVKKNIDYLNKHKVPSSSLQRKPHPSEHPEMREFTSKHPKFKKLTERLGKKTPPYLYAMGNINLLAKESIAFSGSRAASQASLSIVEDCVHAAVRKKLVIISGYARGVDTAAHYQALKCAGETIIVLPEGMDHFKIKRVLKNVWDWERVLVISQYQPNEIWRTYRAMERNATIIALSHAVIIIAAGETGGTLAAGKKCLQLNVPLYVIDNMSEPETTKGNQILIKKGGERLGKSMSDHKVNIRKVVNRVLAPQLSEEPSLFDLR